MFDVWGALLFRADEVDDEALALGFALALAGFDVERPRVEVAALSGLPGWCAAFYSSGVRVAGHDELTHLQELFLEADVTPGVGVRLATAREGGPSAMVHVLVHGAAAGVDLGESLGAVEGDAEDADDGDADDVTEDPPEDGPGEEPLPPGSRGSTRLAEHFGRPVLADLTRALFESDRTLTPRLADPSPAGVTRLTSHLVDVLRRVPGRGSAAPPKLRGVAPPPSYAAFVAVYDFADPTDPADLYREIDIGHLRGTLRFLRSGEIPASAASVEGYPVAEVLSSHLSQPRRVALLALQADGSRLRLDNGAEAGPTFAELLRYLALGYTRRTALEEEIISALMLRAAVRVA